ncbi:MAG: EVE domain-containing protein [Pseudomonadota bacterium]
MAYWLIKSEPETWSFEMHQKAGSEEWDGVRNYQARNNMRLMKLGERAFFYHSVKEQAVVGVCEVSAEAHPDSTDDTGKWDCCDFVIIRPFAKPVTLREIKAEPSLADMVLVKNSRLSVQPVRPEEWNTICRMGETDPT